MTNYDFLARELADLDAEHRYIYDLVRRFREVSVESITSRQLHSFIGSLARHMEQHWTREEAAMRSAGFPGLAAHILSHQEGLNHINQMLSADKADKELIRLLEAFLPAWLDHHIAKTDAEFEQWLKLTGPAEPLDAAEAE